jgi:hypothetical protein
MAFGWTSYFRQGAWREFRRFVLNQRRDVVARLTTINAELDRIGSIEVLYERNASNPNKMTERRIGLNVTPNTSIERLLRAYIAAGGNPFDISMFLIPDSVTVVDTETETNTASTNSAPNTIAPGSSQEEQPYGGIAHSSSTDPLTPGLYTGGWLPLWRYPPRRFGGAAIPMTEGADMARTVHAARGWVTQEIRTLRNDLEARIIKLMDLREQLTKERDELLPQAVGGAVPGLQWSNDGQFAASHNVSVIVDNIDSVFYPETNPTGGRDFDRPRTTGPNPAQPMLLDDAPNGEEDYTAIG